MGPRFVKEEMWCCSHHRARHQGEGELLGRAQEKLCCKAQQALLQGLHLVLCPHARLHTRSAASSRVRADAQHTNPTHEPPHARYLDTGMFLAIWGLFVVPSVVIFSTLLFILGRHIREVTCAPKDRSIALHPTVLKYTCYECGGREPTQLYTPQKQICYFFTMMGICLLVLACGIWAMVGTEHWTLTMMRSGDEVGHCGIRFPSFARHERDCIALSRIHSRGSDKDLVRTPCQNLEDLEVLTRSFLSRF